MKVPFALVGEKGLLSSPGQCSLLVLEWIYNNDGPCLLSKAAKVCMSWNRGV